MHLITRSYLSFLYMMLGTVSLAKTIREIQLAHYLPTMQLSLTNLHLTLMHITRINFINLYTSVQE